MSYLLNLLDDVGHAKRFRNHRLDLQGPRVDVGFTWLRLEGLWYSRDENCKPAHRFGLVGDNLDFPVLPPAKTVANELPRQLT